MKASWQLYRLIRQHRQKFDQRALLNDFDVSLGGYGRIVLVSAIAIVMRKNYPAKAAPSSLSILQLEFAGVARSRYNVSARTYS